jgi:DNA-binding MarR family transcriptional regulator
MAADHEEKPLDCNCAAIRQAARYVTRHYDQHLARAGLRATQFSILQRLKRLGPLKISVLASAMGMDRTTLGRNILPLERDGLIEIGQATSDLRTKQVSLTRAGAERLRAGLKHWRDAQQAFEESFGAQRAAELRALLGAVVTTTLER